MSDVGSRSQPPRTRWLLVTPLAALALVIGLVVVLEAVHPQVDADELDVELVVAGVPELAIDGVPTCVRRADEAPVAAIRDAIAPGGRISSKQVHACPMAFDGLRVTFVGEVVGELIQRRQGVWAQVNDDDYALEVGPVIGHREHRGFNTGMSVWLPDPLHEQIGDVGRPAVRGDVIAITGTLLQADPDDGGGITIRADSLEVLASAVRIDPPFHALQAVVAVVLGVAAIAAIIWARATRSR